MKRNLMDKVVGFFSPTAEARRLESRMAVEFALRAYDGAQSYPTSDWISANNSDPNKEIKAAQKLLREKSRDLTRNNPFAVRALEIIVNNTVGAGIIPHFMSENEKQLAQVQAFWKIWGEGTLCDLEGRNNFYGQQGLALRSTVESGDCLAVQVMSKGSFILDGKPFLNRPVPRVQLLESDFIASDKDEKNIVQGVELSPEGQILKFHVYTSHPGGASASSATVTIDAIDANILLKQLRPGQRRGVPWNHAVIEILKDLDDYMKTTLIKQKVAACFAMFIKGNKSGALLTPEDRKAKRAKDFVMSPASVKYLGDGEEAQFANPPSVNDSGYVRDCLRAIAAGYGISYEAFTGDYSQVNYSSARMGHIQFLKNIESWQWNILIPQFCEPSIQKFLLFCQLNGIKTEGLSWDWVTPPPSMIDPGKEVISLGREVRSGFKTWGEALREYGRDPEQQIIQLAKWNEKFDEHKLALDIDPRRMSQIGFAQAGEALPKLSPDAPYLETAAVPADQAAASDIPNNPKDQKN